jgi:hypothetical protein
VSSVEASSMTITNTAPEVSWSVRASSTEARLWAALRAGITTDSRVPAAAAGGVGSCQRSPLRLQISALRSR